MTHLEHNLRLNWTYQALPPSKSFHYIFSFATLIPPFFLKNRKPNFYLSEDGLKAPSFITIKNSYLIVTWLHYLNSVKKPKTVDKKIRASIAFLPIRRTTYTITKAPMAHKAFSKEQIVFKYYYLVASFKAFLVDPLNLNSVNAGLASLLILKKFFPVFSTNLLFLKHYRLRCYLTDKNYFSYRYFLQRRNSN